MKSENQDEVVREIPVYLSKSLFKQLHVFQYPVKPHFQSCNDENITKAQVKPESMQVELDVEIQTKSKTYNKGKGEQIACNVDGSVRDGTDGSKKYFSSHTMDKLVLTSSKALSDVSRYGVAVMGDNSLHLTPISSVLSFHPSFNYLDLAAQRTKQDSKQDSYDDPTEEESAHKVTVRFERPETERSKALKEKSYSYLQKKKKDEAWIPVEYNKHGSEKSKFDSRLLYCSHKDEVAAPFVLGDSTYLNHLVPHTTRHPTEPVDDGAEIMEKLQQVLKSAKVSSFDEILECFGEKIEKPEYAARILHQIQNVAVLVQGNWVVKSDILYPKDAKSQTPNELVQKARDYILHIFNKNLIVERSSLRPVLPVSDEILTKLLQEVAFKEGGRGVWTFLLPRDEKFLKKHSDVVTRQDMIWQARHEQLCHSFNQAR